MTHLSDSPVADSPEVGARPGLRPPKFAGQFAVLDFESWPLPAISLFPEPTPVALADLSIDVCGLDCKPRRIAWPDTVSARDCERAIESTSLKAALICQIFNWSEEVEWEGVRVADFLDYADLDPRPGDYVSFFSRDGSYFESLPADMALDDRTLLATGLNGDRLGHKNGGPVRLVVPFLQGYKSVKWLGGIRLTRQDPGGIKRLLSQSKTAHLGRAWRLRFGIAQEPGAEKTPV
jgi:hypothetical protein